MLKYQAILLMQRTVQLKIIPLADNTMERQIFDISEYLGCQLMNKMELPSSASQWGYRLYSRCTLDNICMYVLETNVKKYMIFCKPTECNTQTSGVPKIIDDFFNENDILWKNCVGLCRTSFIYGEKRCWSTGTGSKGGFSCIWNYYEFLEPIKRKAFRKNMWWHGLRIQITQILLCGKLVFCCQSSSKGVWGQRRSRHICYW